MCQLVLSATYVVLVMVMLAMQFTNVLLLVRFGSKQGFLSLCANEELLSTVIFLQKHLRFNVLWSPEQIVVLSWATWKKRCELRHDNSGKMEDRKLLSFCKVEWALSMVNVYQKATAKNKRPNIKEQWAALCKAIRSFGPTVMIFTDAGFPEERERCNM